MLAFLYTNPMVVIFIVSVIVLIMMYYYFKSLSVKGKSKEEKKEKVEQKAEEPKEEKPKEVKTEEPEKVEQEEPKEEPESTVGRGGKKSRVTQIYRRPVQKSETETSENVEEKGDYQADFVDISKNVSKFKTLKEEDFGETQEEPIVDEYGFVAETKEDCEFCEDKVKHFDHSRRLSNFVKDNNFDGMFGSHLSDYYMFSDNIDKHLNLTEENLSHLYEKANKTIENSEKRVTSDTIRESIAEAIVESDQEVEQNEDISSKVDLRNIVLTDSIMNRKKKK